jgi:hypothetical protein
MNAPIIGTDQGYQVAKRVRQAKLWMVRSGSNVVGPVSLELLERGLEAGKIPSDAEIADARAQHWCPVAKLYPNLMPAQHAQPASQPRLALAAPPVPPPPPSIRYPEEPISVPRLGVMAALFS